MAPSGQALPGCDSQGVGLSLSQVAINAQMLPWDDAQITRFGLRVALFARRGADPEQAEYWADRLALRDQQRDDRRSCIECAHRQDDRRCFVAKAGRMRGVSRLFQAMDFTLQRCGYFKWQMP